MKTYWKSIGRMFKTHIARLLSVLAIVIIAVGFVSGIGSSSDMVNNSVTKYYKSQNVSDLIIKSKSGAFTDGQIKQIEEIYGAENIQTGMSVDIATEEKRSLRLCFVDFDDWKLNVPELLEGSLIESDDDSTYAKRLIFRLRTS